MRDTALILIVDDDPSGLDILQARLTAQRDWLRSQASVARLESLKARVTQLEQRLAAIEDRSRRPTEDG